MLNENKEAKKSILCSGPRGSVEGKKPPTLKLSVSTDATYTDSCSGFLLLSKHHREQNAGVETCELYSILSHL